MYTLVKTCNIPDLQPPCLKFTLTKRDGHQSTGTLRHLISVKRCAKMGNELQRAIKKTNNCKTFTKVITYCKVNIQLKQRCSTEPNMHIYWPRDEILEIP